MNRFRGIFSVYLMIGFMVFGLFAQANAQNRNEREVRDLTRQLNNKVDSFQNVLSNQLRRNSKIERQDKEKLEDDVQNVKDDIRGFETSFNRQRETANDVTKILESAKIVNDFIKYNSIDSRTDRNWEDITNLLDNLASNYNVNWSWDNGGNSQYPNDDTYQNDNNYPTNYPSTSGNSYNNGLIGTYQLDASRSENAQEIADRAIRNSNSRNNQADRADLENKLQAPEQIAVDIRGNQVTLGTSLAQPITFTADGRDQTQTTDDGRTIRVRATLRGQDLTISSLGGDTDYTLTFSSTDNGKSMKVSRRITTNYLRQTVFAESVYNKTDSVARLGGYNPGDYPDNNGGYSTNDPNDRNNPNNNPNNYPVGNNGRRGDFIVPNGTILSGTLDNDIDTKVSQNNDKFRMTVQSPNQFRGAVVEGYLSGIDRSGKISGRSEVTFNFQTIRLANGQSYDFAGNLQTVTDENGKTIKVDQEGAAKGDSQTKETVKRGGIGAGIGAIIGAIAGGAKGAAIGAVIGGGAGAGSVVLQGKDDLQLKAGSQITVQSSSPLR
jgi:hypothetical protein